jgi:hypothetical protein
LTAPSCVRGAAAPGDRACGALRRAERLAAVLRSTEGHRDEGARRDPRPLSLIPESYRTGRYFCIS